MTIKMLVELVLDRTLTKRPCIYKKVDNVLYPIMYLAKAEGATDEDFNKIIDFLLHKAK